MDQQYAGLVYIPHRMEEMGYGKRYDSILKSFLLAPSQILSLNTNNAYYIQIKVDEDVRIGSKMGFYDPTDPLILQQTHEHQGQITIQNTSTDQLRQVEFILVIPKNNKR